MKQQGDGNVGKFVFFFGNGQAEGDKGRKDLLGGKGAGLAEMTSLGLPVPPGFTLSTEVCTAFTKSGAVPSEVTVEIKAALARVEQETGMRFGDAKNPLLVSVRSGARASMPGMMDTILNLGLTEQTLKGLSERTKNRKFALDAYRRFIVMYADVALSVPRADFEALLDDARMRVAKSQGVDVTRLNLEELKRKSPIRSSPRASSRESLRLRKRLSSQKLESPFPTT
jgi:pyruvate, orthophosphate dikinase